MTGAALVVRGDARHLPLPDASVDLLVTSPPYFSLRSYLDGGEHYAEQIGSEETPAEWLDALIDCTREWMRVLKPPGSLWINLGDKYDSSTRSNAQPFLANSDEYRHGRVAARRPVFGRPKSLMGLPWRYALRCIDDLGLILRAEIIWSKPNGLPESVTDRVRRSHETWFHFTVQPRYYSAVDEIRESHTGNAHGSGNGASRQWRRSAGGVQHRALDTDPAEYNPLGKLPGSVWSIPSEPLQVPEELGIQHFAAFPLALPRRIILGWSPPGICVECGEGRRPVVSRERDVYHGAGKFRHGAQQVKDGAAVVGWAMDEKWRAQVSVAGYACACTPYTDHPERRGRSFVDTVTTATQGASSNSIERNRAYKAGESGPVGPVREYHFDQWQPAPTRPAVILDPFGGTGTTSLVAKALGRVGVSADLSHDYSRLARWRTTDPGELAKALRVEKPPTQTDGQEALW